LSPMWVTRFRCGLSHCSSTVSTVSLVLGRGRVFVHITVPAPRHYFNNGSISQLRL